MITGLNEKKITVGNMLKVVVCCVKSVSMRNNFCKALMAMKQLTV